MEAKFVKDLLESWADAQPWNIIYNEVTELINNGKIRSESDLESVINNHEQYNISIEDAEDAVWAAWTDSNQ